MPTKRKVNHYSMYQNCIDAIITLTKPSKEGEITMSIVKGRDTSIHKLNYTLDFNSIEQRLIKHQEKL